MMGEQEHLRGAAELSQQRERFRSAVVIKVDEEVIGDERQRLGDGGAVVLDACEPAGPRPRRRARLRSDPRPRACNQPNGYRGPERRGLRTAVLTVNLDPDVQLRLRLPVMVTIDNPFGRGLQYPVRKIFIVNRARENQGSSHGSKYRDRVVVAA